MPGNSATLVQLNRIGENMSGVFALFLIISGNFLGGLFNSNIRNLLRTSAPAKHIVAFFTLYFFVVLIDTSQVHAPILEQIGRMLVLYAVFVVLNCSEERFVLLSLFIMAMLYFIRARRQPIARTADEEDKAVAATLAEAKAASGGQQNAIEVEKEVTKNKEDEDKKRVKQQQTLKELDSLHITLGMSLESALVIVLFCSLVLGFFVYAGYTHSFEPHDWRWSHFVFGVDNAAPEVAKVGFIPVNRLPSHFAHGLRQLWNRNAYA